LRQIDAMTIQRKDGNIIITVPESLNSDGLQRLITYIEYTEATQSSVADQEQVDELAKEVNSKWWNENKLRFTKE